VSGGRRVWACITCYRVQASSVRPLLNAVIPQVERVLLFDNTAEPGDLDTLASEQVAYLRMPANVGTAGTMNEAWRLALDAGVDYVVAFDQDSVPGRAMIPALVATFEAERGGRRIAAVGPRKLDSRTNRAMRVLMPVTFFKRYARDDDTAATPVDHLVSSGCLISAEAYRAVGPFNGSLFLDYVDIEWCLRARRCGFALMCDQAQIMRHAIGDDVWLWRWRAVPLHSPVRNGMLIRNHLLLWRLPVSRLWLLSDLAFVGLKLAVNLLIAGQPAVRLRWIARGLADGIRGRGGAMAPAARRRPRLSATMAVDDEEETRDPAG
jgi:rhamnosyltransferase